MNTRLFAIALCICFVNGGCIRDQVREATLPISPFAGAWSMGKGAVPESPSGKRVVGREISHLSCGIYLFQILELFQPDI